MTVGSLCFIFYNQSLGKRWVMGKDQTELGELGTLKRFQPVTSGSQGRTVWSTPSSIPPPNQTMGHPGSLSVVTIMSMSVSNFDEFGLSN